MKKILIISLLFLCSCSTTKKPIYEIDYDAVDMYYSQLQGWIDGYKQCLEDTRCNKQIDKIQKAYIEYSDSLATEIHLLKRNK